MEIPKNPPSRYRDEPEKIWILAYYALLNGSRKRAEKLKQKEGKIVNQTHQAT